MGNKKLNQKEKLAKYGKALTLFAQSKDAGQNREGLLGDSLKNLLDIWDEDDYLASFYIIRIIDELLKVYKESSFYDDAAAINLININVQSLTKINCRSIVEKIFEKWLGEQLVPEKEFARQRDTQANFWEARGMCYFWRYKYLNNDNEDLEKAYESLEKALKRAEEAPQDECLIYSEKYIRDVTPEEFKGAIEKLKQYINPTTPLSSCHTTYCN